MMSDKAIPWPKLLSDGLSDAATDEINRLRALEYATRDENECLRALNAELVEAADLMLAYEDHGGDGWWKGWDKLKAALTKAGERDRLRILNAELVKALQRIVNEGDDLSIIIARAAIDKAKGEEA